MTLRVEVSGTQTLTYTQAWNVENRLTVVTNTVSGEVTRFVYDGNGQRVLREDAGGLTVYVGAIEVRISATERVTTSYYYVGGQRVAMQRDGELTYLHGDHLGSASLATDASGVKISDLRYRPFGETRYGDAPTDRRFTGQREESSLGLYDYNARFYSAGLGRFLSADSIVPDPGNPQALNRYAYVLNNPLRYTDPTGHLTEEQINRWCGGMYDKLDQETRDMLSALHFGDRLYLYYYLTGGVDVRFGGKAELGDSGLQFAHGEGIYTIHDLLDLRSEGVRFGLLRRTGTGRGDVELAYLPWDSPTGSTIYAPTNAYYHQTTGFEESIYSKLPTELKSGVVGAMIGGAVGGIFKGSVGGPKGALIGLGIGLVVGVTQAIVYPDPLPGNQTGDEILEYWYDDGRWEVTTIRNNRVIETRWNTWWEFPVP